ncbi:MAG TPA: hypothetical protein PKX26_13055, partial [Prolixibacteraceae bacterium]|nr:hypothetical protein [Prolixibacteraceae bacterium]HOG97145.1 hypothetical protein [Prolixibacteraceae bacterium]HOY91998.1 hypothetical protein [Prolixibacteraceae bacterium]
MSCIPDLYGVNIRGESAEYIGSRSRDVEPVYSVDGDLESSVSSQRIGYGDGSIVCAETGDICFVNRSGEDSGLGNGRSWCAVQVNDACRIGCIADGYLIGSRC